jgi:hypothetical protein
MILKTFKTAFQIVWAITVLIVAGLPVCLLGWIVCQMELRRLRAAERKV